MEAIAVFHQKFPSAHQSKSWSDLITEFEIDLIKIERQLFVTLDTLTDEIDHHLFMGRPQDKLILLAVFETQEFFAILLIASALFPQRCRCHKREADLLASCLVKLLFDHCLDPVKYFFAKR